MRLIFTSELTKPVIIDGSGGVNKVVYYLVEGLVKKGHEVILLASGDSKTSAKLIPVIPQHLDGIPNMVSKVKDLMKVKASVCLQKLIQSPQDIIVNHLVWRLLLFCDQIQNPIVTTTHNNPLSTYAHEIYRLPFRNRFFISISQNQHDILTQAGVNIYRNIYNGIPIEQFTYQENPQNDYLFHIGRISKGKGLSEILMFAKKIKKKAYIAGDKDDAEEEYYDEIITQIKDDPDVINMGEIDFAQKNKLISKAYFFLFPLHWEEPFGLVVAESLACGTPVIAYARGSMPEMIQDGKTGFLVNESPEHLNGDYIIKKTGLDGLQEAIEMIYALPKEQYIVMRKACRTYALKKFSLEQMIDAYEAVFLQILAMQQNSSQ